MLSLLVGTAWALECPVTLPDGTATLFQAKSEPVEGFVRAGVFTADVGSEGEGQLEMDGYPRAPMAWTESSCTVQEVPVREVCGVVAHGAKALVAVGADGIWSRTTTSRSGAFCLNAPFDSGEVHVLRWDGGLPVEASTTWDGQSQVSVDLPEEVQGGIGVVVEEGAVVEVLPGTPAERAGVRVGDQVDSAGLGPVGSPVTIHRPDGTSFEVARRRFRTNPYTATDETPSGVALRKRDQAVL